MFSLNVIHISAVLSMTSPFYSFSLPVPYQKRSSYSLSYINIILSYNTKTCKPALFTNTAGIKKKKEKKLFSGFLLHSKPKIGLGYLHGIKAAFSPVLLGFRKLLLFLLHGFWDFSLSSLSLFFFNFLLVLFSR